MKLRSVLAISLTLLFVGWAISVKAEEGEDFLKDKTLTRSGLCRVSLPSMIKVVVQCKRYVGKDGKIYIALFHPHNGELVAIKEIDEKTGEQKNIWAPPLEIKS